VNAEPSLQWALEAILLVVEEPVPASALAEVLEAPVDTVVAALRALRHEYRRAGRGFVLRETVGGWRLYTDPAAAAYVERFLLSGRRGRLSQAALETLAIVAYKQPVTRGEIAEIRGVDADAAIRSLLGRGLIEEVGRDPTPGHPMRYGTTGLFLERLGLASLADLPPLASFAPLGPPPPEPRTGGYRAARLAPDAEVAR
jgi:segregation and condensation protein B